MSKSLNDKDELAGRVWAMLFDYLMATNPQRADALQKRGLTPNDLRGTDEPDGQCGPPDWRIGAGAGRAIRLKCDLDCRPAGESRAGQAAAVPAGPAGQAGATDGKGGADAGRVDGGISQSTRGSRGTGRRGPDGAGERAEEAAARYGSDGVGRGTA